MRHGPGLRGELVSKASIGGRESSTKNDDDDEQTKKCLIFSLSLSLDIEKKNTTQKKKTSVTRPWRHEKGALFHFQSALLLALGGSSVLSREAAEVSFDVAASLPRERPTSSATSTALAMRVDIPILATPALRPRARGLLVLFARDRGDHEDPNDAEDRGQHESARAGDALARRRRRNREEER